MSHDSDGHNDWTVWIAGGALVVILLGVMVLGVPWFFISSSASKPVMVGPAMSSGSMPMQTLAERAKFDDEATMRTVLATLPGRSLGDAMGVLHLPASSVIEHPDEQACYLIDVEQPISGVIQITTDRGRVTDATFVEKAAE